MLSSAAIPSTTPLCASQQGASARLTAPATAEEEYVEPLATTAFRIIPGGSTILVALPQLPTSWTSENGKIKVSFKGTEELWTGTMSEWLDELKETAQYLDEVLNTINGDPSKPYDATSDVSGIDYADMKAEKLLHITTSLIDIFDRALTEENEAKERGDDSWEFEPKFFIVPYEDDGTKYRKYSLTCHCGQHALFDDEIYMPQWQRLRDRILPKEDSMSALLTSIAYTKIEEGENLKSSAIEKIGTTLIYALSTRVFVDVERLRADFPKLELFKGWKTPNLGERLGSPDAPRSEVDVDEDALRALEEPEADDAPRIARHER